MPEIPVPRLSVATSPGDPVVLALAGEVDVATTELLAVELTAAITAGRTPGAIVVDLAEVSFLSAAGVGLFLAARNQAAARRITLRVATGSTSIVSRALEACGALAVLDSYP